MADLEKKYEPRRQQLKALADEIDNLEKQLKAQGDKISETERAHRAKTIDEKKKQGQRLAEDLQNDVQGEMQEVFGKVAGKVYDVLSNYAQQQGYTLVLDSTISRQQAPLILFSDQSTDISKTVLDAYNLKSGVPAPPAQPAAATPPPPTNLISAQTRTKAPYGGAFVLVSVGCGPEKSIAARHRPYSRYRGMDEYRV